MIVQINDLCERPESFDHETVVRVPPGLENQEKCVAWNPMVSTSIAMTESPYFSTQALPLLIPGLAEKLVAWRVLPRRASKAGPSSFDDSFRAPPESGYTY